MSFGREFHTQADSNLKKHWPYVTVGTVGTLTVIQTVETLTEAGEEGLFRSQTC